MRYSTGPAIATFTYRLRLNCGHLVDHTEWEGFDPESVWVPGMGRWCCVCFGNRVVTDVIDPTFNPCPVK